MTKRKQEDPVEKLSTLISQSSFRFIKGINTFFDGVAKNMESLLGPSKDAQKKSDHKKWISVNVTYVTDENNAIELWFLIN